MADTADLKSAADRLGGSSPPTRTTHTTQEMKQEQLFKTQCPMTDDNDVRCQNNMTDEEMKQDGMCDRCACLLSDWYSDMSKPFVFK